MKHEDADCNITGMCQYSKILLSGKICADTVATINSTNAGKAAEQQGWTKGYGCCEDFRYLMFF